ncbi:hypothetical protein [Clostridium butyricum]|nr:hypothetical protein [Clostridium butyricum]
MKEVKKVNVSVIGALIFFSCAEISIKAKITRRGKYLLGRQILNF